MSKVIPKDGKSVDKGHSKYNESSERTKKNWLSRFHIRRNTDKPIPNSKQHTSDHSLQKTKVKIEQKVIKEVPSLAQKFAPANKISTNNLDPVHERISEQRQTIKNIGSEITSNESTPRIEEEEIIIHTLEGGYSEAIKKSFHDKNLFLKQTNCKSTKL